MGMGYGANFGLVIELEEVGKIVPTEFKALMDALDSCEVTLDTLALAEKFDELIDEENVSEEDAERLHEGWVSVVNAFEKETGIGLILSHHDTESEGSRYDGVSGAFIELDWGDMYAPTPQAKKLRDKGIRYELTGWVTYG